MEGWLLKEGGQRKNWKRRYFSCERTMLVYSDSPNATRPKGAVSLREIKEVSDASEERSRAHCFRIVTPQRTFFACAENDDEMHHWIEALADTSEKHRSYVQPTTPAVLSFTPKDGRPIYDCTADELEELMVRSTAHILVLVAPRPATRAYVVAASSLAAVPARNLTQCHLDCANEQVSARLFPDYDTVTSPPLIKLFPVGEEPIVLTTSATASARDILQFVHEALGDGCFDLNAAMTLVPKRAESTHSNGTNTSGDATDDKLTPTKRAKHDMPAAHESIMVLSSAQASSSVFGTEEAAAPSEEELAAAARKHEAEKAEEQAQRRAEIAAAAAAKAAEEEEAAKAAAEEAARVRREREAADKAERERIEAEEKVERERKAEEERAERKRQAEAAEEARRAKEAAEEQERLVLEANWTKKKKEQEAARRKKEKDAEEKRRHKQEEEALAQQKKREADEEAARQKKSAEEEAERKRQAEEEAAEAARRAVEAETRKRQAEEEAARAACEAKEAAERKRQAEKAEAAAHAAALAKLALEEEERERKEKEAAEMKKKKKQAEEAAEEEEKKIKKQAEEKERKEAAQAKTNAAKEKEEALACEDTTKAASLASSAPETKGESEDESEDDAETAAQVALAATAAKATAKLASVARMLFHSKKREKIELTLGAAQAEFFNNYSCTGTTAENEWSKRQPLETRDIRQTARDVAAATFGSPDDSLATADALSATNDDGPLPQAQMDQLYESVLTAIVCRVPAELASDHQSSRGFNLLSKSHPKADGTVGLGAQSTALSNDELFAYARQLFRVSDEDHASKVAEVILKVAAKNEAATGTSGLGATSKVARMHVTVDVRGARGLTAKGVKTQKDRSNDCFCSVALVRDPSDTTLDVERHQRTPIVRSCDPRWEKQVFQLSDDDGRATHVVLELWNDNLNNRETLAKLSKGEKPDFLGRVVVPLDEHAGHSAQWVTLEKRSKRSNISGDIEFGVSFERRVHTAGGSSATGKGKKSSVPAESTVVHASETDLAQFVALDGLVVRTEYASHFERESKGAYGDAGSSLVRCRGDTCVLVPVDKVPVTYERMPLWAAEVPTAAQQLCEQWCLHHGVTFPQRTAIRICSLSHDTIYAGVNRNVVLSQITELSGSGLDELFGPEEQARIGRALAHLSGRLERTISCLREDFGDHSSSSDGVPAKATSVDSYSQVNASLALLKRVRETKAWMQYNEGLASFEDAIPAALRQGVSRMYRLMRRMARDRHEKQAAHVKSDGFASYAVFHQLSLLTGMVTDEICMGCREFHPIFKQHNIDYGTITIQAYLTLLMGEIEKSVSRVGVDLELSASVFDLYEHVTRMKDALENVYGPLDTLVRESTGTDAAAGASKNVQLAEVYRVFTPCVLEWLTVCRAKTKTWVDLSVREDQYKALEGHMYSASVVDVFTCFDQSLAFLRGLRWSDTQSLGMFMSIYADIVCSGTTQFCRALFEQLKSLGFFNGAAAAGSSGGGANSGKGSSSKKTSIVDTGPSFDLSSRVCVMANDIQQAHNQLEGVMKMLQDEGFVDLDKVDEAERSDTQVEGVYDARVIEIFQDCYRELGTVMDELLQSLACKFAPDIIAYTSLVVGTASKDQERQMSSKLKSSKPRLIKRKDKEKVKAVATDEEVAMATEPLLSYLNERLELMSDELYEPLFKQMVWRLWQLTLYAVYEAGKGHLTCRWIVEMYMKFVSILHDFFHANGNGLPLSRLENERYRTILKLLMHIGEPTEDLIKRFVELEVAQEKTRDNETFGKVELDIHMLRTGEERVLTVSIKRATDLPSMNANNNYSDPYVELLLTPKQESTGRVLHDNKKMRTSIKKRTLSPQWEEKFTFNIQHWSDQLVLSVSCMDFELLNGDQFIGSGLVPIGSLECDRRTPISVDLYRASQKMPCEGFGIALLLRARMQVMNDKTASQFVKRRGLLKRLEDHERDVNARAAAMMMSV